ncbi:MAG: hypothetical protein HYV97_10030 [Bdellovibrio sp.]|nr:hypothetical protein [Bdellovibrio sp.]
MQKIKKINVFASSLSFIFLSASSMASDDIMTDKEYEYSTLQKWTPESRKPTSGGSVIMDKEYEYSTLQKWKPESRKPASGGYVKMDQEYENSTLQKWTNGLGDREPASSEDTMFEQEFRYIED